MTDRALTDEDGLGQAPAAEPPDRAIAKESDHALAEEGGPTTRLLTAKQVAERWRVSVDQVYAMTRSREIPALRLGRLYRYKLEAIERFEDGDDGTAHAA